MRWQTLPLKDAAQRLRVLRSKWRDQVHADLKLSFATRCVGYALAGFITMDNTREKFQRTGKIIVFPSQAKLARLTAADPDTVRRSIDSLVDRQHLKRVGKRGNQFTGSNRYRIVVMERANDSA